MEFPTEYDELKYIERILDEQYDLDVNTRSMYETRRLELLNLLGFKDIPFTKRSGPPKRPFRQLYASIYKAYVKEHKDTLSRMARWGYENMGRGLLWFSKDIVFFDKPNCIYLRLEDWEQEIEADQAIPLEVRIRLLQLIDIYNPANQAFLIVTIDNGTHKIWIASLE